MYYHFHLKKRKQGIRNTLHKVRNYLDQKQDQYYNTEYSKLLSSVLRQVKRSHFSQSPCAEAQMTKVWMLTPKSSIQNQTNISKIVYFPK